MSDELAAAAVNAMVGRINQVIKESAEIAAMIESLKRFMKEVVP